MTVYLTRRAAAIQLRARAEGTPGRPDATAAGDLAIVLRPGESALGRAYDEWAALPDGAHAIPGGD